MELVEELKAVHKLYTQSDITKQQLYTIQITLLAQGVSRHAHIVICSLLANTAFSTTSAYNTKDIINS